MSTLGSHLDRITRQLSRMLDTLAWVERFCTRNNRPPSHVIDRLRNDIDGIKLDINIIRNTYCNEELTHGISDTPDPDR